MNKIDLLWQLLCIGLVFFMQAGFTALEAALVRRRNRANIVLKNLIDFCLSSILYFLIGYGLMYGATFNGVVGASGFFQLPDKDVTNLLYQLVFCGAAITISSGIVAGRMRFQSYALIVMVTSLFLYPMVGHWVWKNDGPGQMGWLAEVGFMDFAGAAVVHSVGAWIGFAALLVVGPRTGRFDNESSTPFVRIDFTQLILGVFILWFGWIGFNGGSWPGGLGENVASIVLITFLGGAVGGIAVLFYETFRFDHVSPANVCSGVLAGLVSITGCAGWIEIWSSIPIAFIGAMLAYFSREWLLNRKVDDAVDGIPVHGVAGLWSLLSLPLFIKTEYIPSDYTALEFLGIQFLGSIAIISFTFVLSFSFFKLLSALVQLRIRPEDEKIGLDALEHGVTVDHNHKIDQSSAAKSSPSIDFKTEKSKNSLTGPLGRQILAESKSPEAIRTLFEKVVITTLILFITIVGGYGFFLYGEIRAVVTDEVKGSMKQQALVIKAFRKVYSKHIASRAHHFNLEMGHDLTNQSLLPLPATMTMEISKEYSFNEKNFTALLYSDFPFPWRKQERASLNDSNRLKTIRNLRENPEDPIFELVSSEGLSYYRYSVADRMAEASCVDCHNTHKDSPKTDWKIGDVRGIFEVSVPAESVEAYIQAKTKKPILIIIGLTVLAFLGIVLVLRRFHKMSLSSQENLRIVLEQQEEIDKTRKQAAHSDRLASIGELAAGVGHEINNPLAIIQSSVEHLELVLNKTDENKFRKFFDRTHFGITRIADIVNGVMSLSRRDDGEEIVLDFVSEVSKTIRFITEIYKKNGIDLEVRLPNASIPVRGFRAHIYQLTMNLLSNARDATEGQKSRNITVVVQKLNEHTVEFSVNDNGTGIPEEIRDRIFDQFFTTKETGKGTGLGLGLCTQFVKEMGGKIDLDTSPGKGTRFSVLLPISDEAVESEEKGDHAFIQIEKRPTATKRILLVDDEEMLSELVAGSLSRHGFDMTTVTNADDAIDKIQKGRFDLVISDKNMPGRSGIDLLDEIAETIPDPPFFILLSGDPNVKNEGFASYPFFVDVLVKPIANNDLIALVRKTFAENEKAV